MSTKLTKPIFRETQGCLDGSYGPDRNKSLIAALSLGDVIVLRPKGTRRPETLSIFDAYRYAMRCRVGRAQLEKARDKKARKAQKLAQQRQERAERKLRQP